MRAGNYHIHNKSLIYPRDADPVLVTAGVGAWAEGAKAEIIATGVKTNMFDIHHIILGNVNANDDYVLKLYYDEGAGDVFWGEAAFTRDSVQYKAPDLPIQGRPIPVGSKISATLMSGNGANTAYIKIYTHEYPM